MTAAEGQPGRPVDNCACNAGLGLAASGVSSTHLGLLGFVLLAVQLALPGQGRLSRDV